MTSYGVCFPREFPADLVVGAAREVEAMGADDFWIIEDCFFTGGVSLAAAALVSTRTLNVALGILPAVARNPAITAMELATLAALGPGRVIGGIGHGVPSWMEQIGERTPSPLTTLAEVLDAVRALLRGELVSVEGREVQLRGVQLQAPPAIVPRVLAGVQGPRSLTLAGGHADGVVLADWTGPTYTRWARERAAAAEAFDATDFEVAVFTMIHLDPDRHRARERMAPVLAAAITAGAPGLRVLESFESLRAEVELRGVEAILEAPDAWWSEVGAIGDARDARTHVEALRAAGADRIAFFFPPDLAAWPAQLRQLREDLLPALVR